MIQQPRRRVYGHRFSLNRRAVESFPNDGIHVSSEKTREVTACLSGRIRMEPHRWKIPTASRSLSLLDFVEYGLAPHFMRSDGNFEFFRNP